jgi:geranylgeranyl pyrophosphate synthase
MQEVEVLMRAQADDAHPDLRAALAHLLSSGGKRIRPTLGLLVGKMLGAPHRKLVTLAAAVELLHTATLVHDDLIDGSLLRRGNPTLNARWTPAATVLTGDFIFARAAKLAAETDHLPLMNIFAETLAIIVNGELTQMFASKGFADRENYYQRIYAKTASLLEMCARAAAMVSPADENAIESMRQYGYHLGMAFQIVDDILDFTGEQAEVGKPVGSDLFQGLITLPTLYYIEKHPTDTDINCVLEGNFNEEQGCIERLVRKVRSSDAVATSLEEAKGFVEKAIGYLSDMPDGVEKQALEDLARYTINRRI